MIQDLPKLSQKCGRIDISLEARLIGQDLLIVMSGGRSHIGCICVKSGNEILLDFSLSGHKDYLAAREILDTVSSHCPGVTVVCGGIHFDGISKTEIEMVLKTCRRLAQKLVIALADHILSAS